MYVCVCMCVCVLTNMIIIPVLQDLGARRSDVHVSAPMATNICLLGDVASADVVSTCLFMRLYVHRYHLLSIEDRVIT